MAMSSTVLATFYSQARGIMFYGASTYLGQRFSCQLEPSNVYDVNCISLLVGHHHKLGHLAREASQYLAPLLRAGFESCG